MPSRSRIFVKVVLGGFFEKGCVKVVFVQESPLFESMMKRKAEKPRRFSERRIVSISEFVKAKV